MPKRIRWKKRPKGTEISQYVLRAWTNRQRAWEFLRRSESYQYSFDISAGKRSDAEGSTQPMDAWDFGISEFVDYVRDWDKVENVLKFRLYGANYMDPEEWPRIRNSGADRIAYFRIGLSLAVYDDRLLKLQLSNIANHSFCLLRKLRKHPGGGGKAKWHLKNTPLQFEVWARYLRLLDLEAQSEVSNRQIEAVLYKKQGEEPLTSKELNDKLFADRKQAAEMSDGGYIKFVLADRLERKRTAKKS